MIKLLCKLKRDKFLLALSIFWLTVLVIDFAAIIFNVVQIMQTAANSANLAGGFLAFNIFVFAINVVGLVFVIIYLILKNRKINRVIDKNR